MKALLIDPSPKFNEDLAACLRQAFPDAIIDTMTFGVLMRDCGSYDLIVIDITIEGALNFLRQVVEANITTKFIVTENDDGKGEKSRKLSDRSAYYLKNLQGYDDFGVLALLADQLLQDQGLQAAEAVLAPLRHK